MFPNLGLKGGVNGDIRPAQFDHASKCQEAEDTAHTTQRACTPANKHQGVMGTAHTCAPRAAEG